MKIPEVVQICGMPYRVTVDKESYNSHFYTETRDITVGGKFELEEDIIEGLIHEISEVIHCLLGNRLTDVQNDSYTFIYNHKNFQVHNTILVQTLINNEIINL